MIRVPEVEWRICINIVGQGDQTSMSQFQTLKPSQIEVLEQNMQRLVIDTTNAASMQDILQVGVEDPKFEAGPVGANQITDLLKCSIQDSTWQWKDLGSG